MISGLIEAITILLIAYYLNNSGVDNANNKRMCKENNEKERQKSRVQQRIIEQQRIIDIEMQQKIKMERNKNRIIVKLILALPITIMIIHFFIGIQPSSLSYDFMILGINLYLIDALYVNDIIINE